MKICSVKEVSIATSKRFLVIDGSASCLFRTRGPVLRAAVQAGHRVVACAPRDTSMREIQIDDLDIKYQEIGVVFHEIDMQRQGMNLSKELRAFIQILILIREFRPDVVLSYSIKSSLYAGLAARLVQIPNSFSAITGLGYLFYTEPNERWHVSLFKAAVRRLLGTAIAGNSRVFFQNPDDRDLFIKQGLLQDKDRTVIVNGSGVNIDYFTNKPLRADPITFLMIARVQYHKGVAEYVEAGRILKDQYPETRFQLLGPFDDHPSTVPKAVLDNWIQDGAIEFLGGTSDVRPFLDRCHVCVLPSYREGTPLSLLEAMAVGRPIVTTDVPGCRETVIDGYNGFLVQAKNSMELAETMKRFIDTPELIAQMGRHSRQIVEDKYDVRKVVALMMRTMNL